MKHVDLYDSRGNVVGTVNDTALVLDISKSKSMWETTNPGQYQTTNLGKYLSPRHQSHSNPVEQID